MSRISPAIELIGPVCCKSDDLDLALGSRVEQKHCNTRGIIHVGMFATLAAALGDATSRPSQTPQALVTTSLSMDCAGSATVGDWLDRCGASAGI